MRKYNKVIMFSTTFLGSMLAISSQANNPTISLFPTTVVENLKATGQAASQIEAGLETIIHQIDEQRKFYVENECTSNESDPGCATLRKQMGQTYLDMLKHIEDGLPVIQKSINATKNDLEKRIQNQLGVGISAIELQNLLLNDGPNKSTDPVKKLQSRGGTKLSQRFSQYYHLVRTSASASQNSLAIMASEIYLDLDEAQNFITLTQQEMQRARILVELDQEMGLVSTEMLDVIDGVKGIIFGEDVTAPTRMVPASVVDATKENSFRSPLER